MVSHARRESATLDGWKMIPVEQLGEVRLGRQRSPAQEYGSYQTPYLRVANVFEGYIDFSDVLSMNFRPTERQIYGLKAGDILLNEGQSLELVGRSAIYEGSPDTYCFQNTLVRFRCYDNLLPSFAQAVFQHWLHTGRFMQIAKQTTSIAHLGADRFAMMLFPLPPISEQHRIAEVLDTADGAVRSAEQFMVKLRQMRRGLMSDLLTGRVRTTAFDDAETST
jgi:type I restriction enzyme S subunit